MNAPLRVLLDTNIYDLLVSSEKNLVEKIISSEKVVVYGCKVIRNELRDTPTGELVNGKRLRNELLNAYDLVVKQHDLQSIDLANYLALEYLKEYKGNASREKLLNDFLIIAIASIKGIDIVCTQDNKTMASTSAKRTYEKVNKNNYIKSPDIISFEYFKKIV